MPVPIEQLFGADAKHRVELAMESEARKEKKRESLRLLKKSLRLMAFVLFPPVLAFVVHLIRSTLSDYSFSEFFASFFTIGLLLIACGLLYAAYITKRQNHYYGRVHVMKKHERIVIPFYVLAFSTLVTVGIAGDLLSNPGFHGASFALIGSYVEYRFFLRYLERKHWN